MNKYKKQQQLKEYMTEQEIQMLRPKQICYHCQKLFLQSQLGYSWLDWNHICESCFNSKSDTYYQLRKQAKLQQKIKPYYSQIEDGLYLANQQAAIDEEGLDKLGINAICVCGSFLLTPFRSKFPYTQYKIPDFVDFNILELFDQNYEWIEKMKKQNRTVLLHCQAGMTRSASFTIAYLMRSKNLSYQQAYKMLKLKRPIILINHNFYQQLMEYEEILEKRKENVKENK